MRSITEAARRASELRLGQRLALTGPDDEFKQLADTFDVMLERLDAAFTSQKRFVANAAHELRTPLTAMRTAIEVTLSKPTRTPDQLEAMAARVKRSVERAEATVEALLTLAISEVGPTAQEAIDLATAAEDALDATHAAIDQHHITVEAALEPALARGDRVLLERMIANLVENAVRHNNPGGWIGIRTIQQADSAVFEIANTGPSIPAEQIPTLFEPFARAKQRLNSLRRRRARPLDRQRDRPRSRRHDHRPPATRRWTRTVGHHPRKLELTTRQSRGHNLRRHRLRFASVREAERRGAAGGQGLLVGRRLQVDRAREQKDRSVEIGDLAGTAGWVGRDGGPGVGELGDAVPAHAPRDLEQLRQRLCGGVRRRAGAERPADRPARSFWHFACAALNAGAAGLLPAGMGNRAPPPALGSGKLGTPLARMHLANASGPEPLALCASSAS